MKFKINGKTYSIRETSTEEIRKAAARDMHIGESEDFYYGLTRYVCQEILINEDLCVEEKMSTLAHELAHVYMWAHGFGIEKVYDNEEVCNIVAACYAFVGNTVFDYFNYNEVIENENKSV
jgi:Zn-dependent peptidase ImmA (M78 family)